MIPQSYITEWSEKAQWGLNQQVEQDWTHGDRPPVRGVRTN